MKKLLTLGFLAVPVVWFAMSFQVTPNTANAGTVTHYAAVLDTVKTAYIWAPPTGYIGSVQLVPKLMNSAISEDFQIVASVSSDGVNWTKAGTWFYTVTTASPADTLLNINAGNVRAVRLIPTYWDSCKACSLIVTANATIVTVN